jgi:hypothetical protein
VDAAARGSTVETKFSCTATAHRPRVPSFVQGFKLSELEFENDY